MDTSVPKLKRRLAQSWNIYDTSSIMQKSITKASMDCTASSSDMTERGSAYSSLTKHCSGKLHMRLRKPYTRSSNACYARPAHGFSRQPPNILRQISTILQRFSVPMITSPETIAVMDWINADDQPRCY